MLKIKVSSAPYKKLIGAVAALVNKATSNPNEKTIHLAAKDGALTATACSNSSHKISLTLEVEVVKPGFVYINADALVSMTKSLPQDAGELEVYVSEKAQLTHRINGLGAIAENIFSNQDAFKGIIFGEDKLKPLTAESTKFASVISQVGAVCPTYPNISVVVGRKETAIYGQFSESGFVKYTFEQASEAEFTAYYKHPLLKAITELGDALTIQYNPVTKGLQFTGVGGSFIQNGSATKTGEYEGVDFIKKQEPEHCSKVILKYSELLKAAQWHSYGAQTGDAISLTLAEGKLQVKGSRIEEPAELEVTEGEDNFGSISLPMQGFAAALKAVNHSDVVVLTRVSVDLGSQQIRALLLEPWDGEVTVSAIIYEQLKLNK